MMSSILGSSCAGTAEPRLGRLFTGVSDDVEQQATLLRGWNQTYSQMSAGKFSGTVTEIGLGESRIFSEYTGQTLLQSGELPSSLIAIGLPLRMQGPAVFCGMPDHPDALHVFSGRNGFEFFSPTEMVMAGLVVSRDALSELLPGENDDHRMEKFEAAHLSRVEPTAAHVMREYIKGVIDILEASPHLLLNGPIMATLYNGLVSNVAALIEASIDAEMAVHSMEPNRRWSIVSKAREAITSRPEQPTSMAELCQILGVSRRTLQYCFQDVLNVNPATFLRAVRLNGVRRMLRTASSVTEAATFWGFWRFGHFAQDYAALFGELPSQTHRRYHSRPRNA
ncbi:helix-turn-helix domain-containing protein [Rhodoblastus sp. 17X3]|uniref:helix-turn-helix domain-containing protein n=1 Tax=Rhodoblastus sp. 17X3 TaxID=3047026 RepID=UPI0024B7E514|nr:helix-turn-helix domain-containing protein [Rhodoblastus sp. 17X3]MDI9849651.1 helix-turn-helix domain-containing protein [Rhodoblastus sp. 17X3]